MDAFSILLANSKDSNPCDFIKALNPPLNLYSGDWWVSVNSIQRKFEFQGELDTFYISVDITKPVRFADRDLKVLACFEGSTKHKTFYEEELHYIKVKNGLYDFISIRTTDDRGRTLRTIGDGGVLLLELKFKGIPPPQEDDTTELSEISDLESQSTKKQLANTYKYNVNIGSI